MNYDEFLDNCKKRGDTVYRCTDKNCSFRGIGASVNYHEMNNLNHKTINEDLINDNDREQRISDSKD